jgi:starch synthase
MSFMKGGLVYSDKISTVSPTYAREIQTPDVGCGLDGVLRERTRDLIGILNGIDPVEWDPTKDKALKQRYDRRKTRGKLANKVALQRKAGLKVDERTPVLGLISRLVEQKGVDLIADAADDLLGKGNVQLVILGTGDHKYHELLEGLAKKYSKRLSLNLRFDLTLARQIYGGSDLFLMPSRFEPCGLSQMISFRYGTIPIVRKTGGLADTVFDIDQDTKGGNGFVFEEYTSAALLAAVDRAIEAYADRRRWRSLMQRVMALDLSWNASARNYLELYDSLQKVAQPQ